MNLIWPQICPVCGEWDHLLCKKCLDNLCLGSGLCMGCGKISTSGWTHQECKNKTCFEGMIAIYDYDDSAVRSVINSIKYEFNIELLKFLSCKINFEMGEPYDGVTFVPQTTKRTNWRGFNQAEKIAVQIAGQVGLPYGEILNKVKDNGQQANIKTRAERIKNAVDVYMLKKNVQVLAKKIILVDDVLTTGATMESCAKELKQNGAASVWGLVLAHEMNEA